MAALLLATQTCSSTPVCHEQAQEVPMDRTTNYISAIPDPSRPWGSNCSKCEGVCSGHFLKPLEAYNSTVKPMHQPPSVQLLRQCYAGA